MKMVWVVHDGDPDWTGEKELYMKTGIRAKTHFGKRHIQALLFMALMFSWTFLPAVVLAGISPDTKLQIQPRRASESELKVFLQKLNNLNKNHKLELSEFSSTHFSSFKDFYLNRDNGKFKENGASYHTLWIADINNDGKPDFVWTDEVEGSGHYDYLEIYDDTAEGGIVTLEKPQIKGGYTNIAVNLFSVEDGKTYFHLVSFVAQDKHGKNIGDGATSNAAPGAYYSVVTDYKCFWSQDRVKVEKKKSKKKYE